jgi:uncharacterized LabA/DUF88 family protein
MSNQNFKNKSKVHVYIDGANFYNSIKNETEKNKDLILKNLVVHLKDKHKNSEIKIYYFIGELLAKKDLYRKLQDFGYILIFKDVVFTKNKIKGNCDADLIVEAMKDLYEENVKSIIVSSDGDFAPLVKHLQIKNSFQYLISPNLNCSLLLKKLNCKIVYLDEIKNKLLIKNEKTPNIDETM